MSTEGESSSTGTARPAVSHGVSNPMEDIIDTPALDTGGFTTDADPVKHLVSKLASGQVREMAEAMLDIMPGSETYANMISFRALLKRCIRGKLKQKESEDMVFRAIVFRYHYMRLADEIVIQFQLPRADSKIAMLWNQMEWKHNTLKFGSAARQMYSEYLTKLVTAGFRLKPAPGQYDREFSRPIQYLAACFVEARLRDEDVDKRMDGISDYLKEYRQLAQNEILGTELLHTNKET